ncbi:response regulator transcription factor [Psychromicrobium lacuslunae]|uniref:Transcriptional regulator n=1 Tax=Psychromicrobium lacuslunae TaxID=1618207 RepID=A0A0D4C0D6_9MICC|nr:response regulator transcription factor [Psychromicrobium lacuslunae]AJT42137.1 transcriptional regulator [Psychromicrobium lacuslunae]
MTEDRSAGQVVLVEDDPVIREATIMGLQRFGYSVTSYADGLQALDAVLAQPPEVLLLDVMLPGLNGVSICRKVREKFLIPIIMLSARDDAIDVVQGLEAGADDYVAKPFDLEVLHARIQSVQRRQGQQASSAEVRPPNAVQRGSLLIDLDRMRVSRAGEPLTLTSTEFKILIALATEEGIVLSRSKITREVWGYDWAGDQRLVDVHIQRLRAKLGEGLIETVRGFGYRLVEEP